MNRRDVLGSVTGAGLMVVAGTCFAKPDVSVETTTPVDRSQPDAAVFAACAEFERADRRYEAAAAALSPLRMTDPEHDAAEDLLVDRADERTAAAEAMCDVVPVTLAGHARRAAVVLQRCVRFVPGDSEACLGYLPAGVVNAILMQLAECGA